MALDLQPAPLEGIAAELKMKFDAALEKLNDGFGRVVHDIAAEEILDRFERFELAGPLAWTNNNRLLGLTHLPVRALPRAKA